MLGAMGGVGSATVSSDFMKQSNQVLQDLLATAKGGGPFWSLTVTAVLVSYI